MNSDFYLEKDFFTEDEVDNIVTQIIKQEQNELKAELKFDSTAGVYRDKLSNISFSSLFKLKDLWLEKVSQSYFLFGISIKNLFDKYFPVILSVFCKI